MKFLSILPIFIAYYILGMDIKPLPYIDSIVKIIQNNENSYIAQLSDGSIIEAQRLFLEHEDKWLNFCSKKVIREDGCIIDIAELNPQYFDIIKNMKQTQPIKKG